MVNIIFAVTMCKVMGGRGDYMARKKRQIKQNNKGFWIFILIVLVINFWYIILPVALIGGYIWKRDEIHRFFLRDSIKRLEELTYSIRSGYVRHQTLLSTEGETIAVHQLRSRILGEMLELDQLFHKTKKYLEAITSQEAMDVLQLRYQLQSVEEAEVIEPEKEAKTTVVTEQERVAQIAPEILETYCNVQKDNLVVREKLEKLPDKKEELTAIHEANMQRFSDILDGYLKIKASPKDFFNAEQRIAQAKEAMELFDKALDETIRQFNEADLRDFEISLRMMKKEEG